MRPLTLPFGPRVTVLAALLAVFAAGFGLSACYIREEGNILITGKECTSDDDCDENTECVSADSPNANRVCMPFADGE